MINFSVVRIHLVYFSVQVTTWWWSESSRGLICADGICIRFIDIVALVGNIRFIHLLFRHHLSALSVIPSNPPVRLSFGKVSVLVIIDYRNFYQLFLHWRLKILIWWNYQLIFVSVHSRKNICRNQSEVFPYYYRLYMCALSQWFCVVFFIIWCYRLEY